MRVHPPDYQPGAKCREEGQSNGPASCCMMLLHLSAGTYIIGRKDDRLRLRTAGRPYDRQFSRLATCRSPGRRDGWMCCNNRSFFAPFRSFETFQLQFFSLSLALISSVAVSYLGVLVDAHVQHVPHGSSCCFCCTRLLLGGATGPLWLRRKKNAAKLPELREGRFSGTPDHKSAAGQMSASGGRKNKVVHSSSSSDGLPGS